MAQIDPHVRFHIRYPAEPRWHEPPRLLYDCELVYVSDGEFQLRIESVQVTLRPGDVAIIGPFIDHESWTDDKQHVVRNCLHFDWNRAHSHIASPLFCPISDRYLARYMHPVADAFAGCLRLISPAPANVPILPILDEVFARLGSGDAIGVHLMYAVLHYFLHLQACGEPQKIGCKSDPAVLELKNYIDTHYSQNLSLADFSDLTQLTPSHICQAFRKCIGMPPIRYLNQLRLEHACRLLRNSEMNVAEIGEAVGFADANYFVRFFKRNKGMPPGAYARQLP